MKRDSPEDSLRFSGRDFSQQELATLRAWLEKNHRRVLPLKSVLVYPLQKNFRATCKSATYGTPEQRISC